MTTLAKLKTMNDREIQTWLRKVEMTSVTALVFALLGADGEVRNRVFRNMSRRAADTLKADVKHYRKTNVLASTMTANSARLEALM